MRQPKVGDLVLHNYKYIPTGASRREFYFSGYSFVVRRYRKITNEPPDAGIWSGAGEYYRIDLERFEWLPSPQLSVREFVENYEESVRDLLPAPPGSGFPFYLSKKNPQDPPALNAGMYLAQVTPALYALLSDALGLVEVTKGVASDNTENGHQGYGEAKRMLKEHQAFLRNPALARDAKERDKYKCVICKFSPSRNYGQAHVATALECHHLIPLAERDDGELLRSTLEDVVTVCANCHRLLHSKRKTLLSPDEARRLLSHYSD